MLRTGRDFVASVPSDALNTVIDESYDLSKGLSGDVSRLVRTSLEFQKAADDNFLVTASLIRNSRQVLQTQEDSASAITAYSNDLALFSQTLADSDADLRTLIGATPGAARELGVLIKDVGQPLAILMNNLVSTATIFGVNAYGVRDALIKAPRGRQHRLGDHERPRDRPGPGAHLLRPAALHVRLQWHDPSPGDRPHRRSAQPEGGLYRPAQPGQRAWTAGGPVEAWRGRRCPGWPTSTRPTTSGT
ncbi:hypothetical protein [Nocardioides convexus]|uniref:hypothetical protein n=1 Tax=Nocardioides convexus TaxID=2712224 RepID=UPI00241886E4|nr:hypothetical protein [Nocardioides convexus]